MARVGMVFCDMDGTFLAEDKSIPARNLALLDELAKRHIEFVPCTGRPIVGVPQQVRSHPAVRYVIGANGAVVVDLRANRNILSLPLSKDGVIELYRRVVDLPITFDVFADDMVYSERARYDSMGSLGIHPATLKTLRRVRTPIDLSVPQIVERADMVYKITCFFGDVGMRDRIERAAAAIGGFSCACGDPNDVELMASGVSKGSALEWLCEYMNVPIAASVAFGDEDNDASMLRAAGDGVAMKNASASVMDASDHIAPSNDEAGVAQYLSALLD